MYTPINAFYKIEGSTVTVVVNGDFSFSGSFADAVDEYLDEIHGFEAYRKKREYTKQGAAYWNSLAQLEQVIVALWPTVPKHRIDKQHIDMLNEVSAVVQYFSTGDYQLLQESLETSYPTSRQEVTPQQVLHQWLPVLARLFDIDGLEEAEEDEDAEVDQWVEVEDTEDERAVEPLVAALDEDLGWG